MVNCILDNSNVFENVWIPIISACIGGLLTLVGVIITIISQSHKDRKTKESLIKPFIVVEPSKENDATHRSVGFYDGSKEAEIEENNEKETYVWSSLYITNCANSICILHYITINGRIYELSDLVPLKLNDTVLIKAFPIGIFALNALNSIVVGLYDSAFNSYEYKISFDLQPIDYFTSGKLKDKSQKLIKFKYIDCNSPKLSKRKVKKRNKSKA